MGDNQVLLSFMYPLCHQLRNVADALLPLRHSQQHTEHRLRNVILGTQRAWHRLVIVLDVVEGPKRVSEGLQVANDGWGRSLEFKDKYLTGKYLLLIESVAYRCQLLPKSYE